MRRPWLLLPALLLLAGCGGRLSLLPVPQEMERMVLIRAMGVDATPTGVAVTVSGGAQRGEKTLVLSRAADSISGALLGLQADGASDLFYGHVSRLLLSEAQAARGVEQALDYVLRDIEMRLNTRLYLLRGDTAAQMLTACARGSGAAADQLEAMEEDAGLSARAAPRTVRQVLEDLAATGSSFVPALTCSREGELLDAGYGILRDGALVGWADGAAAQGIRLLLGQVPADVVEAEAAALRVVGAHTRVHPVFAGEKLTGLHIACRVEANVAEAAGDALGNRARCAALEAALARVERDRIAAVLALLRGLDADALDLKDRACLASPRRAAEIRAQWSFAALEIDLDVTAELKRGYDVNEERGRLS